MVDSINKSVVEESQFGSDFYPHHEMGIVSDPFRRPAPYNNAVIGLTHEERIKCAELVYELRGGIECVIKH